MFDLRYHVISLAAVFLALILGILVGVAISDPELANRTELRRQRERVSQLQDELRSANRRADERQAAQQFIEAAYPLVMQDRLAGKRVVVVFVGSIVRELGEAVNRALDDAGDPLVRLRALTVPLRVDALEAALDGKAALAGYRGDEHLADLGRDLGRELVEGGDTPLWQVLADELLEQRRGAAAQAADAVVVVRTAKPQGGETGRFLLGLYEGLRSSAPVVGVESSSADPSAIPAYRRARFSSVDAIETRLGKVALAVLLQGEARGHFGLDDGADAVLPPIPPIEPEPDAGG
jgi:predicted Zn-dependent protease with MMP-like domain